MYKILNDERGSATAYLTFVAIVIIGAITWIMINELVLHVGDWAAASGAADGGTWANILVLVRLTPVVVLLAAFTWAVVKAHRAGTI